MRLSKIFILVLSLFMISACAKTNAVEIGKEALDFTLQDTEGKTVKLSDFKGKVIILDFFASWCPPCRKGIPEFVELQKAYGEGGFTMVGVSLTDARDTKDFAEKSGINYPVLVDDEKASAVYGPIRSIPTTFVIDRDFKIVKMYIGYQAKEVFEQDIKDLMK